MISQNLILTVTHSFKFGEPNSSQTGVAAVIAAVSAVSQNGPSVQ